jgi:hypothetical protein
MRRSLTISRILFGAALTLSFLSVPMTYLDAQKTVPNAPRTDDAADMAFCPKYIAADFTGARGGQYYGFLPRGADGIGKVYYSINGITNVANTYAAYGQLYVWGFMCRIVGAAGMNVVDIPGSNVEITERAITSIYLGCGSGSGGGAGDPGAGGEMASNKMVPVRFDCGSTGGGGTTTITVVTVTSCDYYAVFDGSGVYLRTELVGCHSVQYMI